MSSSWAVPTADMTSPPVETHAKGKHAPLGPLRIGVLVGGGLPELLSLGGTMKITPYFGAGINIGFIPSVKISYYGDATIAYREYDAYGRIYPFGGDFFLGAGVGYATVKGTLTRSYGIAPPIPGVPSSIEVTSDGQVRTLVLVPQLGFLHIFRAGFTLAGDVGVQVPVAQSQIEFHNGVPAGIPQPIVDQYVTPNDQKVRDTLNAIGRTTIPTFNLRIGWLL
jgi:hypothetical protein